MYNLYNIVALTELKGYAMLQFSYMMLNVADKGNYTAEAEQAKRMFAAESQEKMKDMTSVLGQMSVEYRKCEPDQHVAGETYLEVTKLLQVVWKYWSQSLSILLSCHSGIH